jgi:hypothetical protein
MRARTAPSGVQLPGALSLWSARGRESAGISVSTSSQVPPGLLCCQRACHSTGACGPGLPWAGEPVFTRAQGVCWGDSPQNGAPASECVHAARARTHSGVGLWSVAWKLRTPHTRPRTPGWHQRRSARAGRWYARRSQRRQPATHPQASSGAPARGSMSRPRTALQTLCLRTGLPVPPTITIPLLGAMSLLMRSNRDATFG